VSPAGFLHDLAQARESSSLIRSQARRVLQYPGSHGLVDVHHLLVADLATITPPARERRLDEPLGLQAIEGIPDGSPADAEPARQFVLIERAPCANSPENMASRTPW